MESLTGEGAAYLFDEHYYDADGIAWNPNTTRPVPPALAGHADRRRHRIQYRLDECTVQEGTVVAQGERLCEAAGFTQYSYTEDGEANHWASQLDRLTGETLRRFMEHIQTFEVPANGVAGGNIRVAAKYGVRSRPTRRGVNEPVSTRALTCP